MPQVTVENCNKNVHNTVELAQAISLTSHQMSIWLQLTAKRVFNSITATVWIIHAHWSISVKVSSKTLDTS